MNQKKTARLEKHANGESCLNLAFHESVCDLLKNEGLDFSILPVLCRYGIALAIAMHGHVDELGPGGTGVSVSLS